jgi:hypothetical protein
MRKFASEAERAFDSYLELRSESDAIFAESAKKLVDKVLAWRGKQSSFQAIARESGLSSDEIKTVLNNGEAFEAATAFNYKVPETEFSSAISSAESILSSKLIKQAEAKQQAEFNERRFARADEFSRKRMSESENILEYSANA